VGTHHFILNCKSLEKQLMENLEMIARGLAMRMTLRLPFDRREAGE
jgi:hypothetical protein